MIRLLIDSHYLAWRAFYALGPLKYAGKDTGVIYGFLRDIQSLQDKFFTHQFVFCFDSKSSKRKEIYPLYKANRTMIQFTDYERENYNAFRNQIDTLRDKVLPQMGYLNIEHAEGYEADDLIAAVTQKYDKKEHTHIIVSGDEDLYQLITRNVICYNPREKAVTNFRNFKQQYGIFPPEWVNVKAMAGCKTDNILGIMGVGVRTALKHVQGLLKPTQTAYKKILAGKEVIARNLPLVKLPFAGCPKPIVVEQPEIESQVWRDILEEYGIKTLRDRPKMKQKRFA